MAEMTFTDLAQYFDHVADLLGRYDPAPVLAGLRERLAQSVADNFTGAHTPAGEPWPPLRRPGHPPLVRSGDLLRAAVEAARQAAVGPDGLTLDTDPLPFYGLFQQEGTATIPARQFLGFPDTFLDEAEAALADDVLRQMLPE